MPGTTVSRPFVYALLSSILAVGCQGSDGASDSEGLQQSGEDCKNCDPDGGGEEPDGGGTADGGGEEPPEIVSACAGGALACEGDPNCVICIDEGACAEITAPIWIVGADSIAEGCICANPEEPETCQFEFCCAPDTMWSVEECNCVEPDGEEPPEIVSGCAGGALACEGDASCVECLDEGACADGPDPIWIVGSDSIAEGCICTNPEEPETCQFEFCCALGFEWSPEECDCIPCDPPDGGAH